MANQTHILAARPALRRGFTMIEILMVVALMVVLMAILTPSLWRARELAQKAACRSELAAIQQGMQAYFDKFNMYPPSAGSDAYLGTGSGAMTGRSPAMLAQGLMGYLDYAKDGAGPSNNDGQYGFRTRKSAMGGEIYGPYMQSDPKTLRVNSAADQAFIDPWGNEILYFRSQRPVADPNRPAITALFGPASNDNSFFASDDCTRTFGGTAINPVNPPIPAKFFPLMAPGPTNASVAGTVIGSDSYLLISAGPDGIYFTADDIVVGKNAN